MKKNYFFFLSFSVLFLLLGSYSLFSQTTPKPDSPEYNKMKKEGKLSPFPSFLTDHDFMVLPKQTPMPKNSANHHKMMPITSNCNPPLPPNLIPGPPTGDDGSSALINLPFNFCFYGDTFTSLYQNNNGNISFLYKFIRIKFEFYVFISKI